MSLIVLAAYEHPFLLGKNVFEATDFVINYETRTVRPFFELNIGAGYLGTTNVKLVSVNSITAPPYRAVWLPVKVKFDWCSKTSMECFVPHNSLPYIQKDLCTPKALVVLEENHTCLSITNFQWRTANDQCQYASCFSKTCTCSTTSLSW